MTGDGGGRGHWRADQVRPAPASLPSLEVPVAGRRAALTRSENVRIHAEAHRATRVAPFKAGVAKQCVKTLGLGLPLHARRSRYDHGTHLRMHPVTADH